MMLGRNEGSSTPEAEKRHVRSDHQVPRGGSDSNISEDLRGVLSTVSYLKGTSTRTTIDVCNAGEVVRNEDQMVGPGGYLTLAVEFLVRVNEDHAGME